MSYSSLDTQSKDEALIDRIIAATVQESYENPTLSTTTFAAQVRGNSAIARDRMVWPVCLATEAEYEYALNAGTPNPGGDPTVITDPMILAAVQANWPLDPV